MTCYDYSDLYKYVLNNCESGATFLTALGQRFKLLIPHII